MTSDPTGSPSARTDLTTARIGVVGGGQLARMTQRAAIDLGVQLHILTDDVAAPVLLAGAIHCPGSPNDLDSLLALAVSVDVVTLDHELVPNAHLATLESNGHYVRPSADAMLFAQDKLHARRQLQQKGFPVPAFSEVNDADDIAAFAKVHGWPVVLKARRGGYDGRGVRVLHESADLDQELPTGIWLVEAHVSIAMEAAILIARRPSGERAVYPVIETVQQDGICRELIMPARMPPSLAADARLLAEELVETIDAVGIVAVELFITEDDKLVVNELALRPHNSGHATIEGSVTSQFENHIRAVLDWPLGNTNMRAPTAAMVNILGSATTGSLTQGLSRALAVPSAHVHVYGKQPWPGRKIGHITVLADSPTVGLTLARTAVNEFHGLEAPAPSAGS